MRVGSETRKKEAYLVRVCNRTIYSTTDSECVLQMKEVVILTHLVRVSIAKLNL